LLRDVDSYEKQLLVNDVLKTGIKEKCVWLNLAGFNVFNNVAVDILHDCRYVITFTVNYLVQDAKLITVEKFNINSV
jgi:hypothetical protein